MKQLKDVSIFDIQCGKDKVLDVETNRIGVLDVRTNSGAAESLDIWVNWQDTNNPEMINQYKSKYFLIKD